MNESDARSALLVRAYETMLSEEAEGAWSEGDRAWATQSALQSAGEQASAETFIAHRARLAAERLCSRVRAARRAVGTLTWRPWIGWALVLAAFAAGLATDAIGSARQINVLAPPLLALLLWNLAVYAVIAVRATRRLAGAGAARPGPLARLIARAAHAAGSAGWIEGLAPPLAGFARDWSAASAALTASRAARILHTAAAVFAGGALLGMYLRGIALEYRAGWESTFLDASSVHALLSLVLGPAAAIAGTALPDTAALAAIRSSVSPGENAARWIHLYAITVALFVLLPRALMALAHLLSERRLAQRFPLSLDDGYFQTIARAQRGAAAAICIVPYSLQLRPQAMIGLNALLERVYGARVEVGVLPTVPFGGEDAIDPGWLPGADVALVAALFSLAATPERENHGVFVDTLAARLPQSAPLLLLVDESAYAKRFDEADATGRSRREERRAAWRRMFSGSGREAVFVDLERPDLAGAGRALRAALDQSLARTAQD